jgi:purine-binding chemotaxis protein CheW
MEDLQNTYLEEDTLKDRYLIFKLGKESYAIEIRVVIEIIGIQKITFVPELPQYIKGIINLRGKIIPVMDVRLKFRKEAQEYDDRTCIIIIEVRDISIGLLIDSVSEVISIPETNIVPPPEIKEGGDRYVRGIGKVGDEVKMILDCDMLLSEEATRSLANI